MSCAFANQHRLLSIAPPIALSIALVWLAACSSNAGKDPAPGANAAVVPPDPGTGGAPSAAAGSGGAPASDPLAGMMGAAGTGTVMGAAGSGGAVSMHDHGTGGAGTASGDHCVDGFPADATDAQLTGKPDEWKASNGDVDLALPAAVLQWMDDRVWKQSHDAWHNVRRCKSFVPGIGNNDICTSHPEMVAPHQECADAEDGYQFLVMHRHMMQGLMQAFPQHAELFAGFPTFPFEAKDVPEQWRDRFGSGWSAEIKDTATKLEDIENHLSEFATEGDLGKFIQCGGGMGGGFGGATSIHGAMHFMWVVQSSPNSLGVQAVNVGNFMFWKLHGWIDHIWDRYRAAKGLTADEPKLVQALTDQCREMHTLGTVFDATLPDDSGDGDPLPVEHGFFHEQVRPILDAKCMGCHEGSTPMAGLALAGSKLSSATIVKELVGVTATNGGQFKRVAAGAPEQSWLYLKVSNTASSAGCMGACNPQSMPPTGKVELTTMQLDLIRQWIADGAPAPTSTP